MRKQSLLRRMLWLAVPACAALTVGCPVPDLDDRFCVAIDRRFSSAEEEDLLRTAENTYPPREDVIAAAVAEGQDPELLPEGPLWCCGFVGKQPIPYAITEQAVLYLKSRAEDMRDEAVAHPATTRRHHAELVYTAGIAYHDTFDREGETYTGVYAATMHLSWACGTCQSNSGFVKDRIVLLAPEGEVITVFGDGPTAWWTD